jgi:hypothetical protein
VRPLLLDAAHHHAQVHGLDHHAHAGRPQHVADGAGHLLGEPLLHLQPPREHLDDARQLGEPHDAAVRDVGDVHLPDEGEHVVLAHRVEVDVAHEHHVLVLLLEHGVAHHVAHVHVLAAGEPGQAPRDALRRLQQPVPVRILAEQRELTSHQLLQLVLAVVVLCQVHARCALGVVVRPARQRRPVTQWMAGAHAARPPSPVRSWRSISRSAARLAPSRPMVATAATRPSSM